jgi:hypothetical protein
LQAYKNSHLKVSGNGHHLSGTGRFKSVIFSETLAGKDFIALAYRLNLQASKIFIIFYG